MSRVTYGTISLILLGSLVAAFVRAQDNSWSSRGSSTVPRTTADTSAKDSQVLLQRFRAASRTAASEYLAENPSSPSVPRLLAPPQSTTAIQDTPSRSGPTTLVSHESSDGSPLRSVLLRSPTKEPTDATPSEEEASPREPEILTPPQAPPTVQQPSSQDVKLDSNTTSDPAPLTTQQAPADALGTSSGVSSRRPRRVQVPASHPTRVAARRVSSPTDEAKSDEPSRTVATETVPSIRIDTVGPPSMTLGSQATYQVLITNLSDIQANGVTAAITVPGNVQVLSADSDDGQATVDNSGVGESRVAFTVEQLAGRDSARLTLRLNPTTNESFVLATDWALRAPATSAQIEVKQALLEIEVSGPPELVYGDTDVYTIVLANPGNGDAKNVSIQVSMGDDTSDTLVVGTVPAGSRKSFDVEITARQVGGMQVAASATGDNNLQTQASRDITIRRGKLQLDAQGPGLRYAGTTGSYAVRVANTGDAVARGVQASVQLPEGVQYVRGIENARQDDDQLVWRVGDLAPGSEQVYQFQCEMVADGDMLLRFTAVSADDLKGTRDVTTRVEAIADLTLAVKDPKGPLPVGKDVTYEIQITNRGTEAALNVNVVGQFSEGIEPVSTSGMQAELATGQVVFDPIVRINPGDTLDLTVTARADKSGNHVFRAAVQCEDPETRLVAEDTTRFYGSDTLSTSAGPAPATPSAESARSPAPAPNFGSGSWR